MQCNEIEFYQEPIYGATLRFLRAVPLKSVLPFPANQYHILFLDGELLPITGNLHYKITLVAGSSDISHKG